MLMLENIGDILLFEYLELIYIHENKKMVLVKVFCFEKCQ